MLRRTDDAAAAIRVTISPRVVARVLTATISALLLAGIAGQVSTYRFGHAGVLGLVALFDLDAEMNVPAWYSASVLLICGVALGVIAMAKRRVRDRYTKHWTGLALGFVYLSADETISIHETIGPLFAGAGRWLAAHVSRTFVYLSNFSVYTWVLPAGVAVLVIATSYTRFLLALPRRVAVRFVLAGLIFLAGTIGVEVIGAWYVTLYGMRNIGYGALVVLEEGLEMTGIAYFLFSLLTYAQSEFGAITVQFTSSTNPPPQVDIEAASVERDLRLPRSA